MRIEPDASPEEVAAIMAALEGVKRDRDEPEEADALHRSRWRLAGLLGYAPPRGMGLEGSLWSYPSWED